MVFNENGPVRGNDNWGLIIGAVVRWYRFLILVGRSFAKYSFHLLSIIKVGTVNDLSVAILN